MKRKPKITLNTPKQPITKAMKLTSSLSDDLAKLLRARGYKLINYGPDYVEAVGFGIQIKLTIQTKST